MPPPNQGQGPQANVQLNFDTDQWRAEMARASAIMAEAFQQALGEVASNFTAQFRNITNNMNAQFQRQANATGDAGARAGRNYSEQFSNNFDLTQSLQGQLTALQKSASARGNFLDNLGLDRDLLAGVDSQIEEVVRQLREFEKAQKEGLSVEQALAYSKAIETAMGAVRGELRSTEVLARQLVAETDRARSANTASSQQETTLGNATIRSQAQVAIQASQRAARVRIELARFTFRQIQFFERQIANAIQGTFSAVGSLTQGAIRSVGRLTNVFRRSDNAINDGLRGALIQREGALDRSFRRQSSTVSREVARQSATIQRFERQASTGLAGIATGRSGLGLLLGGGIAVGAGYKLAQGLRAGFEEAVNLNEAMNAVEQIFGSATDKVVEFTETSVDALFLTQSQALKAAQNFGVFGRAADIQGEKLAGFSNTLTTLATDLASFYNTSVPEAVTSISAALRGESEPIRRFGVLLNEQILQQRALADGIINEKRVLQPGERVRAAYAEILAQTAVAQGDAARTADDFANSSRRAAAASTTFFASIAEKAVPVAEVLLRGLNPALEGMTDFINNNVSPALQLLRTGLIGAAGGLAALLAARGALEVLQFMAITLRAVATPLGLVITAFAGLGAALAILRDRSPAIAIAFENLRDVVTGRLIDALQFVGDLALRIGNVFRQQVLPVLVGVVALISGAAVRAFQFLGDILTDTVIPALQRVGGFLLTGFRAALPVLEAVVTQIIRVGQAIGDAFTGDFGGLASIGSDILAAFAGIGEVVIGAITPQLQRVRLFITDFFSGINWEAIGLQALEVVYTIGNVLGSIVTDPRFITALAGVAAAAAAVVGAFVAGVATGVAENIPALIELLNSALLLAFREAFKAVFADPALFGTLAIGAAGIALLRNAFLRIGTQGGGSFVAGLKSGLGRAAGSITGIFSGIFGPSATQQFERAGARNAAAYQRAFEQNARRAQILGSSIARTNPNVDFNASDVRRSENALKGITQELGNARAAALLFRGSLAQVFSSRSFGDFQRNVRFALSNVNWAQLGQTVAVGFMFGFTSYVSGQQGGTAGIVGVISSAITAGVATGNAYVGLAVAAAGAVGALKAQWDEVNGASERAKQRAAEYQEEVDRIAESLIGLDRAEQTNTLVDELAKNLRDEVPNLGFTAGLDLVAQVEAGMRSGRANSRGAAQVLLDNLGFNDTSSDALLSNLTNIGAFNAGLQQTFDDLEQQVRDNPYGGIVAGVEGLSTEQEAARTSLRLLDSALKDQGATLGDFETVLGVLDGRVGTFATSLAKARDSSTWITRMETDTRAASEGWSQLTGQQRLAREELNRLETEDVTRSLFERIKAQVEASGGSLVNLFDLVIEAARAAGQSIDIGFLAKLINMGDEVDATAVKVRNFYIELQKTDAAYDNLGGSVTLNIQAIQEWNEAAFETDEKLRELAEGSGLVQAAIDQLNDQRTDRINAQIDTLSNRLDAAKEAADQARESLTAFITGNYQDTPSALVDDLISSLPNVAEALVEAQKLGGERGAAAFRSTIGDLDGEIADIVQAGFEAGLSGNQINALFNPLRSALGEVTNPLTAIFDPDNLVIPAEVTDRIFQQIQRDTDARQIDIGAQAIFNAEREVRAIQGQLDAYRAELELKVIFKDDQIKGALAAAGLDRRQIELVFTGANTQGTPLEQGVSTFLAAAANLITALGAAPAGATVPNVTQIFTLPTTEPQFIASESIRGITELSTQAGGGTPTRNVIYSSGGSAGTFLS